MAELISRPSVKIHGLDVSEHVRAITLDRMRPEVDTTSAQYGVRTFGAGLVDGSVVIDWKGVIGEEDRITVGQTGRLNVIADQGQATSATNPEHRMRITPFNIPSPSGRIGELSTEQTTFRLTGYSVHSAPEEILHTRTQIGHWHSHTRAPWWIVGAFESNHVFDDRNRDPEHSFSAAPFNRENLLPSFDESRHVIFIGCPTDLGGNEAPSNVTFSYDTGNDTVHPLTLVGDDYVLLALAGGETYEDECGIYRAGGTYDTARAPQSATLSYA